jgi:hypothetical protein
MVGILLENSLNAGVSCRKHRRRSYLGEQFRQICDPPTIELLHGFDEPASEILICEWFTQPMKFLHDPVPRHRIGQASLVAQLFFTKVRWSLVEIVMRALSSLG